MGGTAWLFADIAADQQFDYLFVDEAGQVSAANLAAMGACARNLVLGAKPHPALKPTGVVFWPMDHTGCSQKSLEEAREIERI